MVDVDLGQDRPALTESVFSVSALYHQGPKFMSIGVKVRQASEDDDQNRKKACTESVQNQIQ